MQQLNTANESVKRLTLPAVLKRWAQINTKRENSGLKKTGKIHFEAYKRLKIIAKQAFIAQNCVR